MSREATPAPRKKSRLGCASCKKLRIKCNEGKPSCEYCIETNRICEYIPVPPIKRKKKRAAAQITQKSQIELEVSELSSWESSIEHLQLSSREESICNIEEEIEKLGLHTISSDVIYYNAEKPTEKPTVVLHNPLYSELSIASYLTSYELNLLEFFLSKASLSCSVGLPSITKMWQTSGLQLALQSDLVLNAVFAFSSNVLERLPSMSVTYGAKSGSRKYYLQNSITLLRDKMARDKSTHNPIELILASYLISAVSIAEDDFIPVLSRNGGVDLLGVTQGSNDLFLVYNKELTNSFARALILYEYNHLIIEHGERLRSDNFDFVTHLRDNLSQFRDIMDPNEFLIYEDTLSRMNELFTFAILIDNMYPIFACFFGLSTDYRRKCRQGRPFALIILAFFCAIYRRTVFRFRTVQDPWDKCLQEIPSLIPPSYRPLYNDALGTRQGFKFTTDIMKINQVPHLMKWQYKISEID